MNQTADKTSGLKSTNTPISEKVSEDVIGGLANGKSQELLVSFDSGEIDALVESLVQQGEFEAGSDVYLDYTSELLTELKTEVLSGLPAGFEVIDDYSHLPISFIRFDSEVPLTELLENPDVLQASVPQTYQPLLQESLGLINQPEAEAGGYTGEDTAVAVLDTGADANAPGLVGRVKVFRDFTVGDENGLEEAPNDDDGHGTNVSAIVAGVAPGTDILALDVFGKYIDAQGKEQSGADDPDIIRAIDWAIDNKDLYNIKAINMSLGSRKLKKPVADGSDPFGQAIAKAKQAGILSIVASGNEFYTDALGNPAAFQSAVSVGAVYDFTNENIIFSWKKGDETTRDSPIKDRVAAFSNSASFLDLLAPGETIIAGGLSQGGTSQAAPHVAGAVAVLSQAFPNDSADQILARLQLSGPLVKDHRNQIATPRLDLAAALNLDFSRPPNNNLQNSNSISSISNTVSGTNEGATSEPGETASGSEQEENNSVWWSWDAPTSGQVTVDTFGSDFDTILTAYTGDSVSDLTEITSNDNSTSNPPQSEIVFNAVEGTTYHFAVDGVSNQTGDIALNLSQEVPDVENDNFSNSLPLTDSADNVEAFNFEATTEEGEPLHAENELDENGGSSVWWNWTAPTSSPVTITTNGSDFDTVLAVYTGDSVSDLTEVASDDDSGQEVESLVTFEAVEGTNYKIAVDGFSGEQGNIVLDLVQQTTPIANDNFADSAALTGTSANATASNVNAFKQADEPDHAENSGGSSIWWNWTAPESGLVNIDTFGSNFDTLLAAYTGSSLQELTEVASNDDGGFGSQSQILFAVEAGTNYKIAVDGFDGEAGDVELALSLQTDLLANDNFANRISLNNTDVFTARNEGATSEPGEPAHAENDGGASLWWTYTAPESGTVTINTDGSDFDTILAAYTGSTLSELTEVASSDDSVDHGLQSEIIFDVEAGETYNIAVDGFDGEVGNVNLEVFLSPFANDIDLSSQLLEITSPEVRPGELIDVDFSVNNTGSDAATGFDVDFFLSEANLDPDTAAEVLRDLYLSEDDNIDLPENFLPLDFTFIEGLPGNSSTDQFTQTILLPALDEFDWDEDTDYQIGMAIDIFDETIETEESNNTIATSIEQVTFPTPDPDQSISGNSQGELLNGGTGDDTIFGFAGSDTLGGSDGDDSIVGHNGRDFLYGQDGDDTLEGRPGFDRLFGGDGDDVLNGGLGRDRLNGGPGDDTMTGGASIDFFIYNSNEDFDSDDFGVDTILEFQQRDLILLDKSTFTALDSAAGDGFSVDSDFAIVDTDDNVDSSGAFIVYSEASGGLFYNSDGEMNQFAILDGAPTISEDNFVIRN